MKRNNLYEPVFSSPSTKPNSVLVSLFNMIRVQYWDTVSKYLDEKYRITNSQARSITGIQDTVKMSRLLKMWVKKGLLEGHDIGYRGNYFYKKVGVEIPKKLDLTFILEQPSELNSKKE